MTQTIFEVIMLICFGAAWPLSILKSYRSRQTGGKSVIFLYVVLIGYLAGIVHKLINDLDWVICLYVLNALMVRIDIVLYQRNRRLEAAVQQAP
ncbi:MAG: hypothetical protein RRC34_11190 [Lentisphaeria bacterium]|nr:hypothetical protein [Lentisphaeria bacterium]